MSVDIIHTEQTKLQPVVWVCLNPECVESPLKRDFPFQSDYPRCPKCKAEGYPIIQKRVLIHALFPDPNGPIPGRFRRYRLPCDKTREHLATPLNGESCTDNMALVNCPGCLKAWGEQIPKSLGDAILLPDPAKTK